MNTTIAQAADAKAGFFTSHDGAALRYRHWPAARPSGRALLLFHRGHEHSGRWEETVAALGLEDVDIFAWDARGHGESHGIRGSAEHVGVLVRDVDCFVRHVIATYGIAMEEMILVAHSVGAVVATAWVHDYAPPIRGLVLATPAFRVRLYVPLAVPLLRLRERLLGPGFVKSYVKPGLLTRDARQAERYAADPSIFPQIAVNVLLDLHDTGQRLIADAAAVRTPLLLLTAGADWVVDNDAQLAFFNRAGSTDKAHHTLAGFHHAIFHERGSDAVVGHSGIFVTSSLACSSTPRRVRRVSPGRTAPDLRRRNTRTSSRLRNPSARRRCGSGSRQSAVSAGECPSACAPGSIPVRR